MTTVVHRIAIPDAEFHQIHNVIRHHRYGKVLENKKGDAMRFYMEDGKMYAKNTKTDEIQEVIALSVAQAIVKEQEEQSYRNVMLRRLRKDFPQLPNEELEAYADILNEGNTAIKELMCRGYAPSDAASIVRQVLELSDSDFRRILQLDSIPEAPEEA